MENAEMKIVKFDCGDVLTTSVTTSGAGSTINCENAAEAPNNVYNLFHYPIIYESGSSKLVPNESGDSYHYATVNRADKSSYADVFDDNWHNIGWLGDVYDPDLYYHDLGEAGVRICYNDNHHVTN